MNKIDMIIKKLKKYDKETLSIIILELLLDEKIKYEEISILYTRYLENKTKISWRKQRLLAGSLASKYQKLNDDYLSARDSILLQPHVPDEFIEKYVPKVKKKTLEKEKKLLKKEGVL